MANVRTIHADWFGGYIRCSDGAHLAYQFDHRSNLVVFDNAPKIGTFYLIVRMKQTPKGRMRTLEPIWLEGPFWLIPEEYTEIAQNIIYQIYCESPDGFIKYSAKFTGMVLPSLSQNDDIDPDPEPEPEPSDRKTSDIVGTGAVGFMMLRN